jgi:hypothetical protein
LFKTAGRSSAARKQCAASKKVPSPRWVERSENHQAILATDGGFRFAPTLQTRLKIEYAAV